MRGRGSSIGGKARWLWLMGGSVAPAWCWSRSSVSLSRCLERVSAAVSPQRPPLASTGPTPSAYALQTIPPERLRLYQQAGTKFNIDWSFLASIGAQECARLSRWDVLRWMRRADADRLRPWQRVQPRQRPHTVGTLRGLRAPRTRAFNLTTLATRSTRPRGSCGKTGAPPTGGSYAEYHQAACHYYGACGDATVSYAEEVMARAVQYGFTGSGAPIATSPPLAQPVSAGGCEASTFSPEAASSSQIVKVAESQIGQGEPPEGSNCTIYGPCEEWCSLFAAWVWQHAGVRSPARPPFTGTPGRCTPGRSSTAGRCSRRRRRPHQATPSSTEAAPARALTSGSCSASTPTGESPRSRATTPTT